MLGTISVSGEENVIQVDPPSPLGVTSQTLCAYFAYVKDLNFVQWGWGENLGKAMFMSVYRGLAVNSTE